MDYALPLFSNASLEEFKTFSFKFKNVEYLVVITILSYQIKSKISYIKDFIKKEYVNYFALNDIYKLNEAFVKFKSIEEFYTYFISNFFLIQKIFQFQFIIIF
jgi:hypothetical protein